MCLKEKNIKIIFCILATTIVVFIIYFYSKTDNKEILTNNLNYYTIAEKISESTSEENYTEAGTNKDNLLNIIVVKMDHSVKNTANAVIAYLYYDKPVIRSNTEIAKKINNFFENEYQGWLNGVNRITYYHDGLTKKFLENLDDYISVYSDDFFAQNPFKRFVNFEVTYLSENILSIRQISYYITAGPSYTSYFGTTFDLKTGEVIPINELVDIDADTLKNMIYSFVSKKIKNEGYDFEEYDERNQKIYAPNKNHDFKLGTWYEVSEEFVADEINYDYYYDGSYFYIIVKNAEPLNYEFILKWNGKTGDKLELSQLTYTIQKDNTFKLMEWTEFGRITEQY